MRLFVAISLPSEVQSDIHRALKEARQRNGGVRWVRSESYHVTLAFLGEVAPSGLAALQGALGRVVFGRFSARLGAPKAVPNVRRPQVLWYGLEGDFSQLHDSLGKELGQMGFPPDSRPWTPHVTVGRLRKPGAILDWPPPNVEAEWEVTESVLMQSHLRPGEGPRYEVLHGIPAR